MSEDINVDTGVSDTCVEEKDVVTQEEAPVTPEETKVEPTEDKSLTQVPEAPKDTSVKEDVNVRNVRLIAKAKEKLRQENLRLAADKKKMSAELEEYKKRAAEEDIDYDDTRVDDTSVDTSTQIQRENSDLKKQMAMVLQRQEQQMLQSAADKLQAKHADFVDVVSDTNASILEELDPVLFKEIVDEQDVYKKGIKAYKAIRDKKIYQSALDVQSNKEAIIKNMAKPGNTASSPKKSTENSSVFADLHSKDYQNMLRRKLEEAEGRM